MSNNQAPNPQPHVCPHQISFFLDNWIRRLIQNPQKIVGPYIQAGNTVMDMGCGPGYFTIDMAKLVGPKGRVIAIDIQTKMLERVRKKAQNTGWAIGSNITGRGPTKSDSIQRPTLFWHFT